MYIKSSRKESKQGDCLKIYFQIKFPYPGLIVTRPKAVVAKNLVGIYSKDTI